MFDALSFQRAAHLLHRWKHPLAARFVTRVARHRSPGVVIGGRSGRRGAPDIGDRVKIGEGARVGANAVVIEHVAPGDVVVGIPARPIERRLKVIDGIPDSAASG